MDNRKKYNKHRDDYVPYSFVNPYNFMPLGGQSPSAETDSIQKYTGVIEYSLRTVTPLFIPDTGNENAFDMERGCKDHKSYDFFSYRDLSGLEGSIEDDLPVPVIPGSEMRGMLRNNYEILTNSCMSAVDDEVLLSKRTQEKYAPGLLERCEKEDGSVKYRLIRVKDDCLLRTRGKNSLEDDPDCWKPDQDRAGREIRGKKEWGRQCYIQDSLAEGEKVTFTYKERKKTVSRNGRVREEMAGKPLALDVKACREKKPQKGRSTGYILKGEAGPKMKDRETGLPLKQNKHCAHIFREPDNIEEQVIKVHGEKEFNAAYLESILDAVLTIYEKNGVSIYKEYRERYEEFKKGNGNRFFPVYYSLITYERDKEYGDSLIEKRGEPQKCDRGRDKKCVDSLMLSPACITREIYTRMLSDMAGDKKSCEKSGRTCPACALFGTFRKGGSNITSRIRVTDLECLESDLDKCFDKKPITLQPLSQPKFNPEFYMERPDEDAVFWTYEYYVDSRGIVHKNTAGVNGRKFYWHHADFDMKKCTAEPDKMNKTIRPLKKDICFGGKIYFQDLSEKELNTLCYLINAGDDDALEQKKHGYKLGSAKPLGFGSVAMRVDRVLLRQIEKTADAQIILKEVPYEPEKNNTLVNPDVASNFEKMTDFYLLSGENISYPRRKPGDDIFGWFAANHKGYNRREGKNKPTGMPQSRTTMLFDQYLKPMVPKTVSTDLNQKIFKKDR